MTEQELLRTLRTVGMTCFVEHFSLFHQFSEMKCSIDELIEKTKSDTVSENSARTKGYAARRIFNHFLHNQALKLIVESHIINNDVIDKANALIVESEESLTHIITDSTEAKANDSIWSNKVDYNDLNARQKETYNLLKLGAVLSDYGFDLLRLNDDWQGADCIANHIDGDTYLKVQLKGRLTVDKKYIDKDIYIAFRNANDWYLYPHDEFVDYMYKENVAVNSRSWNDNGHYNWPNLSSNFKVYLNKYKL